MKSNFINNILIMLMFFVQHSYAKKNSEFNFSEKFLPQNIGNNISERFIQLNKHELYRGKYINYQEVCVWVAALRYAQLTENKELEKRLTKRFDFFFFY